MRAFATITFTLLKFLGIIALFLASVVVGVLVALQSDWARAGIKDTIVGNLNNSIRGRIEVERLGGSLPFSIVLEGVRIHDPDGGKTLSIESISASVDPFQLLEKRVEVSQVAIVGPDFQLFDSSGSIAIARAFAPRTPSTPRPPPTGLASPSQWVIKIQDIAMTSANLENLLPDRDLEIHNLELSLALGFGPTGLRWQELAIDADIGPSAGLDWLIAGGALSIRSSGVLGSSGFELETLSIQAGPHAISLSGRVDLKSPGSSRLTFDDLQVDTRGWPFVPTDLQGVIMGQGSARARDDGANTQLVLFTPVGELWLQAGVTFGDLTGILKGGPPTIGDWSIALEGAHLRVPDAWIPAGSSMADVIGRGQVEVMVTVDGHGLPGADNHRLRADVDMVAVASDGSIGHGIIKARHLPAAGSSPAGWGFRFEFDKMGLQPWLSMVGLPTVDGMLEQFTARGIFNLDPKSPGGIDLIIGGGVRASFDGTFPSGPEGESEPLRAAELRTRFQLQWNGADFPVVSLFLRGQDLIGFGSQADAVSFRLFSGQLDDTGGASFDGELTTEKLKIANLSIGSAVIPLSGRVTSDFSIEAASLEPQIQRFKLGADIAFDRLRGPIRLVRENGNHRLRGQLSASDVDAGPAAAQRADVEFDARLPLIESSESFVNTVASADLTVVVTGVRALANGQAAIGSESTRVNVDVRWPRGFAGPLDTTGTITADGVRGPDFALSALAGRLDARIDPSGIDIEGLLPSLSIVADLGGIALNTPSFLDKRTFRSATITATHAGKGVFPIAIHVDVDDDYAFDAQAEVVLPGRRRAFEASVKSFALKSISNNRPWIDFSNAYLNPEGVLSVSGLAIHDPESAGSLITAGGYIDLQKGEIDANIDLIDVDIAMLVRSVESFLNRPIISSHRPAGLINADIDMFGTLADPTLAVVMTLENGAWEDATGLSANVLFNASPAGLTSTIKASWRNGQPGLTLEANLPGSWSLAPPSITWDESRSITANLDIAEGDIAAGLASFKALTGIDPGMDIRGAITASVAIGGRPGDPSTRIGVETTGLVVDGFDDGDIAFVLDTASPETNIDLNVKRRNATSLAHIRAAVPFTPMRALAQADPVAYALARMKAQPVMASILMPMTALGRTPLGPFLSDDLRMIGIETDIKFEGRLDQPTISGRIDTSGLAILPEASVTRLQLSTALDTLTIGLLTITTDGTPWLDADLRVPTLSRFVTDPGRALEIFSDPDFRFDAFTADIRTFDFWRLLPGLGDTATQFMPDGSLMVHLNARGGVGGPTGTVKARLRTYVPPSYRDATPNPRQRAGYRNIANDMLISAQLTPVRTNVKVLLLQEPANAGTGPLAAVRAHEHLGIELLANLGTEFLLSGRAIDIDNTQIVANIDAHDFRLNGIAAALRSVLGSTAGTVAGRVEIDGTFGQPHFDGDLVFNFSDLTIAPISFRRKDVEARLKFSGENNRVSLEGLEFEDPAPDGGEPSKMSIRLAATIPSLDPEKIGIDGGLTLKRFKLVNRKDATIQLTGAIGLDGTLARPKIDGRINIDRAALYPKLAGRSVRDIGPPAGVTMVRGEPAPPAFAVAPTPFRTGVSINVGVDMPKGSTHLEPNLFLAIGEARAVLEPHTSEPGLFIRTSQGRIGIFGTIFVPTESVQLYGKKFVIDEDSRIVFAGDMDNDPQLRITARWNIQHVDLSPLGLEATRDSYVGVRVFGNAASPIISFISEPRLDEGNMLSIIALGRPTGSGDALDSQAFGQVVSAFMNMATLELGKGLTDTLPIEVLKLDTVTGDIGDVRLTVGKRITNDLYIYYRSDWTGSRQTNAIWAEYRFGKLLFIAAEYGGNQNADRQSETSVRASIRITP